MTRPRIYTYLVLLSLAIAFTSQLAAQQLLITKKTCYTLTIQSDGTLVLTNLKIPTTNMTVVDLRDAPPTTPPTVPPTTPPNPTDPVATHRSNIQASLSKIPTVTEAQRTAFKNGKLALSKVYRQVLSLPITERAQLVEATDTIINNLLPFMSPEWKTWKAEVDKSLASFTALDDAKRAWQVVAEVLEQP